MNERAWVDSITPRLQSDLCDILNDGPPIVVNTQHRLPYAYEIQGYESTTPIEPRAQRYAVDLLISDKSDDDKWIPRVIVEAKLNAVTTHDALTYSAKAFTHKQVHPYLRYGILIGNWGDYAFPARLFRHGAQFDFMMTWHGLEATTDEWEKFLLIAADEVKSSRLIQTLLATSRSKSRDLQRVVHRPLQIS